MGCGGSKALAAVDNPPLPPPTKPVAPPSVTAAAPAAVVPSAAEKPAKPSQATTAALAAAPPATEVSSLAKDISSAASVAPSKQDPPVVLQESPPEAASDTVVDAPGEKAEAPAAVGLSADENGSAEFNRSAEAQQAQVGAADEDTGEAADGGSGRLAGEGGGSEAEQSGRVAEVGEGQEHDFSNRCSEDDGAIQSSHPSLREGEEGEEGVSAEAAAAAETAGAQDTCASAAAVADVAEARDSTDDLPEAGEAAGAAAADAAAAEATPAEAADGIASTADGSTGGDGESSSADATARSSMSSGSGVAVNNPRGGISGAKSGGIVSESRDSSAAAGGGGAPTSNSAGSGGGGGSAFLAHSAISRSLSNDRHRAHTPPLPPHHRPSTSSPLQGPNQHNHQQQQQQHGHSQPSSHSQEKTGPNQQQQQQQQQPVSNERIGSSLLGRSSSNRSLGRPSPQPSTPKQSPSPNHSASPQGMLRPAKSNPHNPLPSPRQPGTPLPRPPSPPMSPHGILRVPGSPAPLFGGMALPLPSPQSFGSSNLSGGSAGAVGGSAGGGSGGGSGGVLPKSGSQQQQQQQSQKQNQQQKSGSTGGGGGGGSNAGASSNNNNSSSSTVSTSSSMPRMPAITQQNAGNLRVFSYTELRAATGAFSRENLLGEGGFGGVYKGHVDAWPIDGVPIVMGQKIVVAVKRLNKDGLQGHKEWLAEVNFLGNIQHPRLVRLLGYCAEEEHRLLVYEFVPNKSLEDHLFKTNGAKGGPGLAWLDRIKVALDAAKGLAYLHDETENQVIFRDFKAANILLDNDLHAKLSDFGLARAGPEGDRTHVSTQVVGTVGYAAPEYVLTGHLTARSDVWSYGVVLVELLTGRRALDESRPREEVFLVDWAKPYLAETVVCELRGGAGGAADGQEGVGPERSEFPRALDERRPREQVFLVDWAKPFLAETRVSALLAVVWCLLAVVWCLLAVVWCLLAVVWCLLAVVWCLLAVVWCIALGVVLSLPHHIMDSGFGSKCHHHHHSQLNLLSQGIFVIHSLLFPTFLSFLSFLSLPQPSSLPHHGPGVGGQVQNRNFLKPTQPNHVPSAPLTFASRCPPFRIMDPGFEGKYSAKASSSFSSLHSFLFPAFLSFLSFLSHPSFRLFRIMDPGFEGKYKTATSSNPPNPATSPPPLSLSLPPALPPSRRLFRIMDPGFEGKYSARHLRLYLIFTHFSSPISSLSSPSSRSSPPPAAVSSASWTRGSRASTQPRHLCHSLTSLPHFPLFPLLPFRLSPPTSRRLFRIMDPGFEGKYSAKASQKVAALALWCLAKNQKQRPTMTQVVESLTPLLDLTGMELLSLSPARSSGPQPNVTVPPSNPFPSSLPFSHSSLPHLTFLAFLPLFLPFRTTDNVCLSSSPAPSTPLRMPPPLTRSSPLPSTLHPHPHPTPDNAGLSGSTAPPTPSSPSPLFSYPLLTPSPPLFPQPHPLPHTRQCRSVSIASPHHPFLPLLPSNRLPSFSLPSPFPPPPHLSPYPTPDNAGLSASPAPITPLRVPPASPMGFLNPGAGGGPGTPGGGGLGGGGLGTPGALGALAMRRAAGPPSPAGVGSFPPAQFNSLNPPPNARFSPRPPQLPVGKQQYTSPLVAALRVKERQHQQVQQQQQQQQQMQASNSAGAGGGAGGMAGGVGVEEGVDDGGGVGTVRERANVGRAVPLAIQVNRPRFGAGTNHERMEGVK
ncbi:unnamed protein product [Closterium sp. NIES-54]